MKGKPSGKRARVQVITDPKKLAWLKSEIEKRKARAVPGTVVERRLSKGS
jgi:hypothetical protein